MLKTILASVTGFGSDRAVLDAAFAAARLDKAHVTALHTRIDPGEGAAVLGSAELHIEMMDAMQRIARQESALSEQARHAFEEAGKRHAASGIQASFTEMVSFENETLHQARLHDMVVMAREPELASERLHTMVMLAGKPVLVPPPKPVAAIGECVAIAWKDTAEAARAVTAAMPILEKAKQVIVIAITEDASLAAQDRSSAQGVVAQLKRHGIEARLETGTVTAAPAYGKIMEICYAANVDLLVSGAYGHSRVREMIFGGVTREMLTDCAIPLLMLH